MRHAISYPPDRDRGSRGLAVLELEPITTRLLRCVKLWFFFGDEQPVSVELANPFANTQTEPLVEQSLKHQQVIGVRCLRRIRRRNIEPLRIELLRTGDQKVTAILDPISEPDASLQ